MIEVRTTPAPIEVVTPIKPSEAIRLGCLTAPLQAFGAFGSTHKACAAGTLALGMGDPTPQSIVMPGSLSFEWWDVVVGDGRRCPADPDDFHGDSIMHLNDDHHWTRERIADYLESIGA